MPGCSAWCGRTPWRSSPGGCSRATRCGTRPLDAGPIAACAVIASRRRVSRRGRAAAVCVGLLTSSAVVVHLMNGAIEGHFHFFVMVSVLALYEDWFAYLLAFAFVLGHHGLMGALEPASVYNHPDAVAHPWRWAAVHALFIGALGIVNVVHWRLNEEARADATHSRGRFRHAFDDAPIGMALTGLDGVVDRANAVLCERVCGDPSGRPLTDLVDPRRPRGRARSRPPAARSSCATATAMPGGCGTTRCSPGATAVPRPGSATASTSPSAGPPRRSSPGRPTMTR